MHPDSAPHTHPSARVAGLEPLWSVDDLHDADLDLLLADRLAESADALRAVVAAVEQRLFTGPSARVPVRTR